MWKISKSGWGGGQSISTHAEEESGQSAIDQTTFYPTPTNQELVGLYEIPVVDCDCKRMMLLLKRVLERMEEE